MTVDEKIRIIDKKIDRNKAQRDLDRQTARILAISTGKMFYWKRLARKS